MPSIVLRLSDHIQHEDFKVDSYNGVFHDLETDASNYHGGSISDEIAALLSLNLGIRAKAGGCTRVFSEGDDEKGLSRLLWSKKWSIINMVERKIRK